MCPAQPAHVLAVEAAGSFDTVQIFKNETWVQRPRQPFPGGYKGNWERKSPRRLKITATYFYFKLVTILPAGLGPIPFCPCL